MKAYEGLKPWSLFFGLNEFYKWIHWAQTNNILSIIWGQRKSQEAFKFLIIDPMIFLPSLLV
jgi:hypothetical protein